MSRIFIGGLTEDASRSELEREFEYFGPLRDAWVARNPPGFGFIVFEDARDAFDASFDARGEFLEIGVDGEVHKPAELNPTRAVVAPGELEIRPQDGLTDELVYEGAELADVRADGRAVLVPLGTWRGKANWRFECLPEVLRAVFVRADFANPSKARLLPGPAQAYLDGRSIGRRRRYRSPTISPYMW